MALCGCRIGEAAHPGPAVTCQLVSANVTSFRRNWRLAMAPSRPNLLMAQEARIPCGDSSTAAELRRLGLGLPRVQGVPRRTKARSTEARVASLSRGLQWKQGVDMALNSVSTSGSLRVWRGGETAWQDASHGTTFECGGSAWRSCLAASPRGRSQHRWAAAIRVLVRPEQSAARSSCVSAQPGTWPSGSTTSCCLFSV